MLRVPAGQSRWTEIALELAVCAGELGGSCVRAERAEPIERERIVAVGSRLRRLAGDLAADAGLEIFEAYARRLAAIERRRGTGAAYSFDGAAAARAARTWRELQLVQLKHDVAYHLNVVGRAPTNQLRHYAFYLAQLAAAFAHAARGEDGEAEVAERCLSDVLLFGLKLATVMGERLPEDPLERQPSAASSQ
jgi:hypothetical protein